MKSGNKSGSRKIIQIIFQSLIFCFFKHENIQPSRPMNCLMKQKKLKTFKNFLILSFHLTFHTS